MVSKTSQTISKKFEIAFHSKSPGKISVFLSLMTFLHHLERLYIVKKRPELELIENDFETVRYT